MCSYDYSGAVHEPTAQGRSANQIARELGVEVDGRLPRPQAGAPGRRALQPSVRLGEIQRFYDEGHTYTECRARFGFSTKTWHDAIARGALLPRPRRMPIEQLLAGPRHRQYVRSRLVEAGLLKPECADCGISDRRGKPLSLELHHGNGDKTDNRLENLRILCPDCHSRTDTWSGRNRGRRNLVVTEGRLSAQEPALPCEEVAPGTG